MKKLLKKLSVWAQSKLFDRTPGCYSASEIKWYTVEEEYEPDKWRPARQCGYTIEFMVRLRLAWAVFTGRHDALHWGEHSGEWKSDQVAYRDHLDKRRESGKGGAS